jgi:small-conductance mechanosensitive channel
MEKTRFLRRMFVEIFEAGSETSWEYRALNYMNSGINIKTYKIQAVDLCVIAALTALCLVLAYRYFNRINDTYQEGIFTVKWIRYAILAGLGFCLGLGITSNIIYYHRNYSLMLVFAGTILITILFIFAADKLMKRRGY